MQYHSRRIQLTLCSSFVLVNLLASPLQLWAQPPCEEDEYVVGYFNGIGNSLDAANSSLQAVRVITGEASDIESIQHQLFYNSSGGILVDVAETFIQRADEIDRRGVVQSRFEYAWDFLPGGGNQESHWNLLVNMHRAFQGFRDRFMNDVSTAFARAYVHVAGEPPTEKDSAVHNQILEGFASDGNKVLMVAHSQGTLFANSAFDHSEGRFGDNGLGAVHIAPTSTTLHGDYRLANIDRIIEALRVASADVPPWNLDMTASSRDWSGHYLAGTYLDRERQGRAAIVGIVKAALANMAEPC